MQVFLLESLIVDTLIMPSGKKTSSVADTPKSAQKLKHSEDDEDTLSKIYARFDVLDTMSSNLNHLSERFTNMERRLQGIESKIEE